MKQKQLNDIKYKNITILCFIIFQLITIITAINHEQWFDEAQAWNIAKLSISEIIQRLPYEQHPILWFLILKSFQKLGLTYDFIWAISYIFTNIAILFLLFKINIDKNIKLMICFFGPFIYFYPVLSREYCLIPTLIFILAYLDDKKIKYSYLYAITLSLLSNTMILVEMFVLILGLQFIYELIKNNENKIKVFINFLILTIGALSVIIPVLYGLKFAPITPVSNNLIESISYYSKNLFLYFFICLIVYKILKPINKKNKIFAYISILYIITVLIFIYKVTQEQKIYIIFFITIYYYIISSYNEQKKMKQNLMLLMYLLGGLGFIFTVKDIKFNFSDSKEIANIINHTDDAIFITNHPVCNVTLSNFENKSLNTKLENQNIIYNHVDAIKQTDYNEILNTFSQIENENIYFIYNPIYKINSIKKEDFEIIYKNPNTFVEPILLLKYKANNK